MLRRLLPLAFAAACASKGGGEGAGGQGTKEVVIPEPPAGSAWKTARGAAWKDVLEDLAGADAVFVSGDDALELAVIDYLFKQERLHAIGLHTFPRTAQKALDDFCFGRIDAAELVDRCGPLPSGAGPVLAFAAERRLPVLGLGLEQAIRDGVNQQGPDGPPVGLDGLTEEQRQSLPALPSQEKFDGPTNNPAMGLVLKLELEVAADVLVRWYRDAAPEGAQVAVLGTSDPPRRLPERLLERNGKTYRTLVVVPGKPESADPSVFAKAYADYVWFVPIETDTPTAK